MKATITKRFEWDSAHRLIESKGECATLHGHRYVAEVSVRGHISSRNNMVVDFSKMSELIGGWIEQCWDHTTFVNSEDKELIQFCIRQQEKHWNKPPFFINGESTVENIARALYIQVNSIFSQEKELHIARVRVYETPTSWADVT